MSLVDGAYDKCLKQVRNGGDVNIELSRGSMVYLF